MKYNINDKVIFTSIGRNFPYYFGSILTRNGENYLIKSLDGLTLAWYNESYIIGLIY